MNFLDKFKGKTNVMTKKGFIGLKTDNYAMGSKIKAGQIAQSMIFRKAQTNTYILDKKKQQHQFLQTEKQKGNYVDSFFQNIQYKSKDLFPLRRLKSLQNTNQGKSNQQLQHQFNQSKKQKGKQEDSFFQNIQYKSNDLFPLRRLKSLQNSNQRKQNEQQMVEKSRVQSGLCLSQLQEKYKDILDQFIIVQNSKKKKKITC